MSENDIANLLYTVGALFIFSMAAWGASRRAKAASANGPGPIVSLLIWLALIALVTALYFGVRFWGAVFSLAR